MSGDMKCHECPYGLDECLTDNYESIMHKDALDLINQQKAEIERLTRIVETRQKNKKSLKRDAYKAFGKFLIDKAEKGIIHADDIPDYVVEMAGD